MRKTNDPHGRESLTDNARKVITEHPVAAVSVALGTGLLLGMSPVAGAVPWLLWRVARTAMNSDLIIGGALGNALRSNTSPKGYDA